MSHADEAILEVHAEANLRYPAVPDCVGLADEPAGDFGIAHFYGNDAQPGRGGFTFYGITGEGCALMSFDVGYTPTRRVILHELGHAIHARFGPPALFAYWAVRGFPLSVDAANAEASRLEPIPGQQFNSWARWPMESFAEDFACLDEPVTPITHDWGVPRDVPALRAFYSSLGREEDVLNMDIAELRKVIREEIAEYGKRLQLELDKDRLRTDELEIRVMRAGQVLSAGGR